MKSRILVILTIVAVVAVAAAIASQGRSSCKTNCLAISQRSSASELGKGCGMKDKEKSCYKDKKKGCDKDKAKDPNCGDPNSQK